MIYPNENDIINYIRLNLPLKDLIQIHTSISTWLLQENHPFICNNLSFQLTDNKEIKFSYYFESTDIQYEDISGIMSI